MLATRVCSSHSKEQSKTTNLRNSTLGTMGVAIRQSEEGPAEEEATKQEIQKSTATRVD